MSTITPLVAPHRITCDDVNYDVSGDYDCGQPASYLYTRGDVQANVCHACYLDYYSKN
jgi:hypothetical protein